MNTTADKLNRLLETKAAIKDGLNACKAGTVTDATPFSQYAGKIRMQGKTIDSKTTVYSDDGYLGLSAVTLDDPNLVSQNIVSGKMVLGVAGTAVVPAGTVSITANGPADVRSFASADVDVPNSYSGSVTIVENGDKSAEAKGRDRVVVAVPASAVTSGDKEIALTGQVDVTEYRTAHVVDPNLVPANIRCGVTILGVTGTFGGIPIPYLAPVYNTASDPASGIKEWKTGGLYDGEYTLVKSSDSTWNAGWHVVEGEVTIGNQVECAGDVKLLLTDGCKLTASSGIVVDNDAALTIYGQDGGTGKLTAHGLRNEDDYYNFPAIGICYNTNGDITINGGIITATGAKYAAGIGGGFDAWGGSGSDITINGGKVTATGGDGAAGIGGACGLDMDPGDCRDVVVNGGVISAVAGTYVGDMGIHAFGDGVGAGANNRGAKGSVSNVRVSTSLNINDGTIPNDGGDLASLLHGVTTVSIKPKQSA